MTNNNIQQLSSESTDVRKFLRLAHSDFYRFTHHKSFWFASIVAILAGISVSVFNLILLKLVNSSNIQIEIAEQTQAITHPLTIATNSISSSLAIYGLIAISLWICSDFQSRCIQNTLSTGHSREQYFASRLLLASFFSALLLLLCFLASLGLSLILFPSVGAASLSDTLYQLSLSASQFLALGTVFATIAFISRNATISIISSLVFLLLLPSIFNLFGFLISLNWEFNFDLGRLTLNHYIGAADSSESTFFLTGHAVAISYIIISVLLGYFHFKSTDI